MSKWDILHVQSLQVEHAVAHNDVLDGLREGRLSRDDCVRKPGEERWWRVYERSEFRQMVKEDETAEEPPRMEEGSLRDLLADAEPAQEVAKLRPRAVVTTPPSTATTPGTIVLMGESPIGAVIDEPDEGLPYQKRHHKEEDELDMTPMVDVAMQLILFFMVTSTMILQSCLAFPKPAPDDDSRAKVAPTVQKLDDLKTDHIMVKIKADNTIYVDEDKQQTKDSDLVAKLEQIKRDRAPNGGIIITAEEAAFHETVVKVVDSANLARLEPIKMAAPKKADKKASTKKRAVKSSS